MYSPVSDYLIWGLFCKVVTPPVFFFPKRISTSSVSVTFTLLFRQLFEDVQYFRFHHFVQRHPLKTENSETSVFGHIFPLFLWPYQFSPSFWKDAQSMHHQMFVCSFSCAVPPQMFTIVAQFFIWLPMISFTNEGLLLLLLFLATILNSLSPFFFLVNNCLCFIARASGASKSEEELSHFFLA